MPLTDHSCRVAVLTVVLPRCATTLALTGLLGCQALTPGFPDNPVLVLDPDVYPGVADRITVHLDVEGCDATGLDTIRVYSGARLEATWTRQTHDTMAVELDVPALGLRAPWPTAPELYGEADCDSGVSARSELVTPAEFVPASQLMGEIDQGAIDREFHWDADNDQVVSCQGARYDAGLVELVRGPEPLCTVQDQLYFGGRFVARIDRDRQDIAVYSQRPGR